jgi:glycosyltransferase involved in cell wall biosynthesis
MSDVAIICGAGIVSGKEIMVLELLAGLRDQGLAVDVLTSSWGSPDFRERCTKTGSSVHSMRLGFISASLSWDNLWMTAHQLLYWPKLVASYRSFLKSSRPPKVIHTNWHHLFLLGLFLKSERDVFWIHEVIPNKWQYRKFFRWLECRLQGFVAVSQAVATSLRKVGISDGKIRVVHNGIADPAPAVSAIQERNQKVTVGIVGQIGHWKGHEDLLSAFALIAPTSPTAELHVFGKGCVDYESKLRKKAVELGIAHRIVWRGFVSDRADIYRDINICVVPSRSQEPLSTVAIEAGFFRIPVIATNHGGFPEIIEDGRTGFLVDAAQPKEIASRLKTLFDNDGLCREMGQNARRRVIEKFNRKTFVENFRDFLAANNDQP